MSPRESTHRPCGEEKLPGAQGSGPPQLVSTLPSMSRTLRLAGRASGQGFPAMLLSPGSQDISPT
jgi:hypothetical protein